MRERYWFSTRRAAAVLGISPFWFRMLAAMQGEQPIVIEGTLAVRWFWTAPTVARLMAQRARGYPL